MKIVNLTTAALELTGGVLLTPAGGKDERGYVTGFVPGPHEDALAEAGKIALVAEPGEPTKADLVEQAKALGIEGYSTMTKPELAAAIAEKED